MFIEPTITWVPLGFSGYILGLDTKIVLKKLIFIVKDCFFVNFTSHFMNADG